MTVTPTQISFVVTAVFATLAMGGRVQIQEASFGEQLAKPKPNSVITWFKDQSYICAQKWEKSNNKHTGEYCLVDFKQVQEGTKSIIAAQEKGKDTPRIRVSSPDQCIDKGNPSRFKVCNLKGKEDMRVHYSKRQLVPQLCFMKPGLSFEGHIIADKGGQTGEKKNIPLLQAAVDFQACMDFASLPDEEVRHLSPSAGEPDEEPAELHAPEPEEEPEPVELPRFKCGAVMTSYDACYPKKDGSLLPKKMSFIPGVGKTGACTTQCNLGTLGCSCPNSGESCTSVGSDNPGLSSVTLGGSHGVFYTVKVDLTDNSWQYLKGRKWKSPSDEGKSYIDPSGVITPNDFEGDFCDGSSVSLHLYLAQVGASFMEEEAEEETIQEGNVTVETQADAAQNEEVQGQMVEQHDKGVAAQKLEAASGIAKMEATFRELSAEKKKSWLTHVGQSNKTNAEGMCCQCGICCDDGCIHFYDHCCVMDH